KEKEHEVVARHKRVEDAHHALHRWADSTGRYRVIDLLVPIYRPHDSPSAKCEHGCILPYDDILSWSTAESGDLRVSRERRTSLAAIVRVNCYDRVGIHDSPTLKRIRETVIKNFSVLQALLEPILRCQEIANDPNNRSIPLLGVLANDFEDAW